MSGLRLGLVSGPTRVDRDPVTAVVTAVDDDGTYVTELGADPQTAIPCRGGHRYTLTGTPPVLQLQPLPLGTQVLVVWTDDGPWIASWDPS